MEERLSLKAQRELFSALLRSSSGGNGGGGQVANVEALHLAHGYLECAGKKRWRTSDLVCRSLAQMIVTASEAIVSSSANRQREVDEDESLATIKRDAAFKEAMRQLTFTRLRSPESLLTALSLGKHFDGENGDAPGQRKVLMSFTRMATSPANPMTSQRTAVHLHRSVDARNDSEEPGSLRTNKRPRVAARQGMNGSETQPEVPTGNATQDTHMVVELPPEVRFSLLSLLSIAMDEWLIVLFARVVSISLYVRADRNEGREARQAARSFRVAAGEPRGPGRTGAEDSAAHPGDDQRHEHHTANH